MTGYLDVGVDLGTTVTKAAAYDAGGAVVAQASAPTTWSHPRPGWAERPADDLFAAVDGLLESLATQAPSGSSFRSIGFTGMAETGSLVRDGRALTPLIAWHDPRGDGEVDDLPEPFKDSFPARSGLPLTSLASIAKILWLRGQGVDLDGTQWLSVPELVCFHLGAAPAAERSMAGRTGLVDLHRGTVAVESLAVIGVGEGFLPPLRPAGSALGRVRVDHRVPAMRGTVLTVAGHDHVVAASGADAAAFGTVFDSFGTAEAFVAAAPQVPSPEQVAHLVSLGMTVYPHVVEGATCVLGGAKSGIVLGRTLQLLGRAGREARALLDAAASCREVRPAVAPGGPGATGIHVAGGRMTDQSVTITITGEDCSPEELWCAALDSVTATGAAVLSGMRQGGLVIEEVVLAGGWSQMTSVVRARRSLGLPLRLADVPQPGLVGAARMGAWAAEHEGDLSASPPATWFAHPLIPVQDRSKEN